MSLKEMVRPGKKVYFNFYRNKELWYVTDCGFEFPVPIKDCGDAAFLREDKAMMFMKYLNKHLKFIEKAKLENSQ